MRHRRKWADRGQNGVHFGTSCPQSNTNCATYTRFHPKPLHTIELYHVCGCWLGTDFRNNVLQIFCRFVLADFAWLYTISPIGYFHDRISKIPTKPTSAYIQSFISMQTFFVISSLTRANVVRLEGVFETTPLTGFGGNQTMSKHHAALAGIARHHT